MCTVFHKGGGPAAAQATVPILRMCFGSSNMPSIVFKQMHTPLALVAVYVFVLI